MIERAGFRIPQQPSNLLQRDAFVFEITKRESMSQTVDDFAKVSTLLTKAPSERPFAHAELFGDHRRLRPSAWKKDTEPIFN